MTDDAINSIAKERSVKELVRELGKSLLSQQHAEPGSEHQPALGAMESKAFETLLQVLASL
jgi:hypothetical protein